MVGWLDQHKERMKTRLEISPRSDYSGPLISPTVNEESEDEFFFLGNRETKEPSPEKQFGSAKKKSPRKQLIRELVIEDYDEETKRFIKSIRRKELIEKPERI